MRIPLLLSMLIASLQSFAQQPTHLTGIVRGKANEPLDGATVLVDSTNVTFTDNNGSFSFFALSGQHSLKVTYVGYHTLDTVVHLVDGVNVVNIALKPSGINLDLVVVSASRYEKRLSEETVSMSVLKPGLAQNTNPIAADELVNRAPGINIVDGQANIRGGSGYSYGAGSRVLVLVDDIPQLTGDAGDVKWDFLPTEHMEQIEIIKGAASTLYGSSAVNGVINMRTSYPTSTPQTNVTTFQGIFDNPADNAKKWWNHRQPFFQGASFSHKRKIGQLDLMAGANFYNEESFLKEIYIQRARANANLRYRVKSVPGLSIGVNSTYYIGRSATFFLWQDDSLGAFIPQGLSDTTRDVINHLSSTRIAVDPHITYLTKSNTRHALKGHFYLNNQPADQANQSTESTVRYAEYQFTKPFRFGLHVTAGLVGNAVNVSSDLYGNHDGANAAAYLQLDHKIGRLGLTAGAREEVFRIDTASDISPVVFRAGLNFKLFEYTHIRASFGQGYRFPTVAEKYVKTNAGSLYAYPNPDLQPETSWSAEIGVQQGFRVGGVEGFFDAAAFTQHLDNFMEFTLGQWGDPSVDPFFGIGFRSENVDRAIVNGVEVNMLGSGKLGESKWDIQAGVMYINPIDVKAREWSDSMLTANPEFEARVHDSIYNFRFLKYRYTTTFKFDVDWTYKRLSLGAGCRYNSFMKRIDPFLELPFFINGVYRFRQEHANGDLVFDARAGVQLTSVFKISLIVKNVTNTEYWDRPARLNAPRNYTLQLAAKF